MSRGFVKCVYVDDDNASWQVVVDADYAAQPERGFQINDQPNLPPLPRGWLPRLVVGLDATGRQVHARVGRVDAALWTGAATEFTFEANDGTLEVAQVVAHFQEKRVGPRGSANPP